MIFFLWVSVCMCQIDVRLCPLTIGSVRRRPADIECMWGQRGDQWCRNTLWGALLSPSLAGRAQGTPTSCAGLT